MSLPPSPSPFRAHSGLHSSVSTGGSRPTPTSASAPSSLFVAKSSPAAPAPRSRPAEVVRTLESLRSSGSAPVQSREFEFNAADFERIRKLIYNHAGIVLSPAKQDMVYSRLARRLRTCGDKTFAQYLTRLERDRGEWEIFVNSLTTNLTSFFRESHHFDILAEQLKQVKERRPIRIWCCAASTGEEPYSLAITACEAFATLTPPVEIVASDIDTSVLSSGEKGAYRRDRVERMPSAYLGRYFTHSEADGGTWTIRTELRRLIGFRRINLLSPTWAIQGPFDAIFCRNVMIYFDKPTQYGILKRFIPMLRPEGRLYAGHSESFMHAADILRSLGRTVYVRLDSPLH